MHRKIGHFSYRPLILCIRDVVDSEHRLFDFAEQTHPYLIDICGKKYADEDLGGACKIRKKENLEFEKATLSELGTKFKKVAYF